MKYWKWKILTNLLVLSSIFNISNAQKIIDCNPAINPPTVIAPSDKPETRYPIAAPGKMACAIASPVKLICRSIKNTPTGVAPTDTAMQPKSARRMKPKSAKGATTKSQIMPPSFHRHVACRCKPHTSAAHGTGFPTSEPLP